MYNWFRTCIALQLISGCFLEELHGGSGLSLDFLQRNPLVKTECPNEPMWDNRRSSGGFLTSKGGNISRNEEKKKESKYLRMKSSAIHTQATDEDVQRAFSDKGLHRFPCDVNKKCDVHSGIYSICYVLPVPAPPHLTRTLCRFLCCWGSPNPIVRKSMLMSENGFCVWECVCASEEGEIDWEYTFWICPSVFFQPLCLCESLCPPPSQWKGCTLLSPSPRGQ